MRSKSKRNEEKRVESAVRPKGMVAPVGRKTSRNSVYIFAASVFLIVAGAILAALWSMLTSTVVIVAVMAGAVAAFSIRIAPQWERVVVLRLGNFNRIAGPGLYFVVPVVEHATAHIDQRMITTPFTAEEALTADLVPLDTDAVLFWMVWNPKDACVEVEDYASAIWWAAQTALRDAVGRINLAEVATRREQLDGEIKDILDERRVRGASPVVSVEIRDIAIPKELQDAMSRKRRRSASATRDSCSQKSKKTSPRCLSMRRLSTIATTRRSNFRTMNLIYESVKEKGGLVIAPERVRRSVQQYRQLLEVGAKLAQMFHEASASNRVRCLDRRFSSISMADARRQRGYAHSSSCSR